MEKLAQYIEGLIFASEQAVTIADIQQTLKEAFLVKIKAEEIDGSIRALQEKYQDPSFAIEIVEINEGFQFMSKGAYHKIIGTLLKLQSNKKLSKSALETLSIIAYKQPVSKSDMEAIRGVNCDYTVQKLLEKELIEILGRAEGPGRPLLYGTSERFMNYFGIKSIKDLPKLKDVESDADAIGEPEEITQDKAIINLEEE